MNEHKSTARAMIAAVLLAAMATATSASAQRAVPGRNMLTNRPFNEQPATATTGSVQSATQCATAPGAAMHPTATAAAKAASETSIQR